MYSRIRRFFVYAFFILTGVSLLSGVAEAGLPLPPRISANGYASNQYAVAQVDAMLPMLADGAHNFYLDPSISYSKNKQGYADLGLGYRWIGNSAAILGVYLFGGYDRIDNNARLWVINPGVEVLGSRWDAHANAYIPLGDRNFDLGPANSAAPPIVVPGDIAFSGHSEFATLLVQQMVFQHAGDGGDIKLAYQLFPRIPLKGYLGTYFFFPTQVNNILGGAAGLEYWVNSNVKAFLSYTYDNLQHNTGALGIGIEFGGTHVRRSDPSVAERITDPTERYLATLGRGSGIPSRKDIEGLFTPVYQLLFNNIAFFSQTGGPNDGGLGLTIANCTYENPCGPTDLTNAGATTLAALLPNTKMYFNGGTYAALNAPGGSNGVTLQPGQSVSSLTSNYTLPATGIGRSTFSGAFILNNNDALHNVIVLPAPSLIGPTTGVTTVNNTTNFSIIGSQIGSAANPYAMGVASNGVGLINNSQIFANSSGVAYGGSSLMIQNSTINVASIASGSGVFINSSNAFAIIQNSQINVSATPNSIGIENDTGSGSTVVVSGTSVNVTAASNTAVAVALFASGNSNTIQFNQGALTLIGPAGAGFFTKVTSFGGVVMVSPGTTCMINGSAVSC